METITRKAMLYKTGVEYGDYAMNHVQGCSHGCTYCYAYKMALRFSKYLIPEPMGQDEDKMNVYAKKCFRGEWMQPKLVSNTLELLDKELPRLKGKIKNVHLCFTTDPYMGGYKGYPSIGNMTDDVISRINMEGIPCTILTKGILQVPRMLALKENFYGITLSSLCREYKNKYEPNAAYISDRIDSLHSESSKCFKTWVSIEPYPTPNIIDQSLPELLDAIGFVDRIVFGRANYWPEVTAYKDRVAFYKEQARIVRAFCEKNNIKLHIKKGTETEEAKYGNNS